MGPKITVFFPSGIGGYLPTLTENHFAKKTLAKIGKKISKKMGQKGLKVAFLAKNTPLTENHCAQKSLAERGGNPPPLHGKNPLSSF